jgi:hypothetical protein
MTCYYTNGRSVTAGLMLASIIALSGCNAGVTSDWCSPDYISDDGYCDEPWYDNAWRSGNSWIKDTSRTYLGDLVGIDANSDVAQKILDSQALAEARGTFQTLLKNVPNGFSPTSLSPGQIMRIVQDPQALNSLAKFIHESEPLVRRLLADAIANGGPALEQLQALANQFGQQKSLEVQRYLQQAMESIKAVHQETRGGMRR